jgi:hypothetical protein
VLIDLTVVIIVIYPLCLLLVMIMDYVGRRREKGRGREWTGWVDVEYCT